MSSRYLRIGWLIALLCATNSTYAQTCSDIEISNHWTTLEDFWSDVSEHYKKALPRIRELSQLDKAMGSDPLVFQSPTERLRSVILSIETGKDYQEEFASRLITAISEVDPDIRVSLIRFSDYPNYQNPANMTEDDSDRDLDRRDMYGSVQSFRQGELIEESEPQHLPMFKPTNWTRDFFIPLRNALTANPHIVQIDHHDIEIYPTPNLLKKAVHDSSYQYWMDPDFFDAPTNDLRPGEFLTAFEANYNGNLLPLSSDVAVVGSNMTGEQKDLLESWGFKLVEFMEVEGSKFHVDYLFLPIPNPNSECGVAMLMGVKPGTEPAMKRVVKQLQNKIQEALGCDDFRIFMIPELIDRKLQQDNSEDGETERIERSIHIRTANGLSIPLSGSLGLILPGSSIPEENAKLRLRIREIEKDLGQPIRLKIIPNYEMEIRQGGVHCNTNEIRCPNEP